MFCGIRMGLRKTFIIVVLHPYTESWCSFSADMNTSQTRFSRNICNTMLIFLRKINFFTKVIINRDNGNFYCILLTQRLITNLQHRRLKYIEYNYKARLMIFFFFWFEVLTIRFLSSAIKRRVGLWNSINISEEYITLHIQGRKACCLLHTLVLHGLLFDLEDV
jgi:hypothetical protein